MYLLVTTFIFIWERVVWSLSFHFLCSQVFLLLFFFINFHVLGVSFFLILICNLYNSFTLIIRLQKPLVQKHERSLENPSKNESQASKRQRLEGGQSWKVHIISLWSYLLLLLVGLSNFFWTYWKMSKVCKVGLTISIKYFSYSVLEARKFLGFILIYSSFKALVVYISLFQLWLKPGPWRTLKSSL